MLLHVGLIRAGEPTSRPLISPEAPWTTEYAENGASFEGPVWDVGTQRLFVTRVSDQTSQIVRIEGPGSAVIWLDAARGGCSSRDGRLLLARPSLHQLTAYTIGADGPLSTDVLIDDARLAQPQYIVEGSHRQLYIADVGTRQHRGGVYLLTAAGKFAQAIHDVPQPAGLGLSTDGRVLYVGDEGAGNWRAYSLQVAGEVGPGHAFFELPQRDDAKSSPAGASAEESNGGGSPIGGLTVDEHGHVYLTARGGIWIVDRFGVLTQHLPIEANGVTFGGADGKTLYATGAGRVISVRTSVHGAAFARRR